MERETPRPHGALRRALPRILIALPVSAALCCRDGAEPPPGDPPLDPPAQQASLVAHPPAARSLAVQLLDPARGTARLLVGYRADARLGPVIALDLGEGPTNFHDDGGGGDATAGDGVYTGDMVLDVAALEARWREVARVMQSPDFSPRQPRFVGREIPDFVEIPPIDVEALLAALRAGQAVRLDTVGTCSVSTVQPEASLFITHPDVIRNSARTYVPCGPTGPQGTPGGSWSFGHLMRQLAGGPGTSPAQVSSFIKQWLAQWQQTGAGANGWPLPSRPLLDTLIVGPWKAASATSGVELDPDKAPFRLLAIVNRIDLSEGLVYGTGAGGMGNAGEVRFVFGALSSQCQPLDAALIFEYRVQRGGCAGVRQWARDWIALDDHAVGSAAYRDALAALTDQVVTPGALGQLRTNELSFDDPAGGSTWDLREFHLAGGALLQHPVAQTPQHTLDGTATLRDYLNANGAAIAAETYEVPLQYPSGQRFRGDHAFGKPELTFWNAAGILPVSAPGGATAAAVRHVFSRNTCNGCHNAETGTDNTHVDPMLDPGDPNQLSDFLTGIAGVPDPVAAGTSYDFADLDRRKQDLAQAAAFGCVCHLLRARVDAPH